LTKVILFLMAIFSSFNASFTVLKLTISNVVLLTIIVIFNLITNTYNVVYCEVPFITHLYTVFSYMQQVWDRDNQQRDIQLTVPLSYQCKYFLIHYYLILRYDHPNGLNRIHICVFYQKNKQVFSLKCDIYYAFTFKP